MNKKLKNLMACGLLISMVGGMSAQAYEDYGFFHFYSDSEVKDINREYSEKFENLENDISKLDNLVNRNKLDNNLREVKKQSKNSFVFNRFKYGNYVNCIESLEDIRHMLNRLLKQEEVEKKKDKEKYEQEIRKKAEETKDFQDNCLKDIQSDFIKSINSSMNQIAMCAEDFSDVDAFSSSISSLQELKEKIIKEIENIKLKDSDRNDNTKIFKKNLESITMSVKNSVERFAVKSNNLLNEMIKVKKDLEQQVIDEARGNIYIQLSEIKKQINDDFNIDNFKEMDKNQKSTVNKFKSELLDLVDKLEKESEIMNSMDEKLNVEKGYKLLKSRHSRYLSRKKAIIDVIMKEKAKEKFIEDIHNPRKVIELLREKKIGIKDVVGGNDEIIEKINDLIGKQERCMKTNKGVPSKGMILYGDPGTGKTSLVKAMAAYHNLDLVTLKRKCEDTDKAEEEIRARFNEARTLTHGGKDIVILLIDEIDAVGPKRILSSESKDTVALLAEIDSLKPSDGIVVLATTNYLEKVDPAVKRSGRLEDKCEISVPNEQGIKEIVSICLLGYKLEEGVDVKSFSEDLVSDFRGMTGADIKRIIECAAQNKLEKDDAKLFKDIVISKEDIREAIKQKKG